MKMTKKILFVTIALNSMLVFAARTPLSDIEFTQQLREELIADTRLSTAAHNVQIITEKDTVTLFGKVSSKAEKDKIEQLARLKDNKKRIFNGITY